MNFSVIPTDKFKKEAKRLVKKFPSLKLELVDLGNTLTSSLHFTMRRYVLLFLCMM